MLAVIAVFAKLNSMAGVVDRAQWLKIAPALVGSGGLIARPLCCMV